MFPLSHAYKLTLSPEAVTLSQLFEDYMLLFLVAEGQRLNFGLNMSPTSVTLPSRPITVDEGRNKHYIDQLCVRVNAEFDSGAVSLKCSSVSSGKTRLG